MIKIGEVLSYPIYKDSEDHVSSLTLLADDFYIGPYKKHKTKSGREITHICYLYDPADYIKKYFEGTSGIDYILGTSKKPAPKDYALIPLRIPGKTVGNVRVNKDLLITEVFVFSDCTSEFSKNVDFSSMIGKELVVIEDGSLVFKRLKGTSPHYISSMTKEMDKYLLEKYPEDIFTEGYTYLDYLAFDTPEREGEIVYAIRTPGATRANLIVDTNSLKIKEIVYCEDTFDSEFLPELKEILNKYIDRKINIRNWRD
ncbi:MAG: hypothetical protein ACRCX8_16625 [Sarcina sp.]